jgi:ABC-2 type transport system ATP-binding protein
VVAVAAALVVVLAVARRRRRRTEISVIEEYAQTPLVVKGLRKEYGDGFVAVESIDFTVQRGQVVGMLGPNGAGKTTTLRVLMGLTQPTKGEVLIFGHALAPGAPVLGRLGALVEGPGLPAAPVRRGEPAPLLARPPAGRSRRRACRRRWRSPASGDAIHRKVRTYSHGMKQRLAIAQAMLGLPELLVLDEPTDGLDPPQIAEMRKVLRDYASDGRAVLVSSHMLAEVEQTCTHVVVMHKGEIVAAGPVDDVVGESPITQFDVSNPDAAEAVLDELEAVRSVAWDGRTGLVVDIDGMPRGGRGGGAGQRRRRVDRVVQRRPGGRVPGAGRRDDEGEWRKRMSATTFSIATELRRQASRPRTRIALGFMVVLPLIILTAFLWAAAIDDNNNGSARSAAWSAWPPAAG